MENVAPANLQELLLELCAVLAIARGGARGRVEQFALELFMFVALACPIGEVRLEFALALAHPPLQRRAPAASVFTRSDRSSCENKREQQMYCIAHVPVMYIIYSICSLIIAKEKRREIALKKLGVEHLVVVVFKEYAQPLRIFLLHSCEMTQLDSKETIA